MIEFDVGAVIIGMVLGVALIGAAAWYEVHRFERQLTRMIKTAMKETMFGLEVNRIKVYFSATVPKTSSLCVKVLTWNRFGQPFVNAIQIV